VGGVVLRTSPNHQTGRILSDVDGARFGPNTMEVERFLERLNTLDRAQWQAIQKAAPEAGAIPEHDVSAAPEYFQAFARAVQAAKSTVFPGSETAFFEAMRAAHHRAETLVAGLGGVARLHRSTTVIYAKGDDPEAILQLMAEEFENETWERAVNACMIAAGALVVRQGLQDGTFSTLVAPIAPLRLTTP
jgi:hypothetical protein